MKFARVMVLIASLLIALTGCIRYISFDSDPRVLRGSWNINLTKSNRPSACSRKIIWNSTSDKFIVDSIVPSIFSSDGDWLQSIKLNLVNINDYNPYFYGYPYLYRDVIFDWQKNSSLIAQISQIYRSIAFFKSETGQKADFTLLNPSKFPVLGISSDFDKVALLSSGQSYSSHTITTVSIQNSSTGQVLNTFSAYSDFSGITFNSNLEFATVTNNSNLEIWKVSTNELVKSFSLNIINNYLFDDSKNNFTYVQTMPDKKVFIKRLDLISKLETDLVTFDSEAGYLKLFPNHVVQKSYPPKPLEIWDLNSKSKILEIPNLPAAEINDFSISPDDKKIAISQYDPQCSTKILSLPSGSELKKLSLDQPATISGSLTFQASYLDQNKYSIVGSGLLNGIGAVTVIGTGYSMSFEAWTKSSTRASSELFNADLQILDSTGRVQLVSMPLPVSTLIDEPVTSQSKRSRTQLRGEMLGAFGTWYDAQLTPKP